MPNNPFYVEPLGGFNLGQAAMDIGGAYKQKQADKSQQQIIAESARVFSEGSPMQQAEFMLKNPQMQQALIAAQGFKSDQTKAARLDGVKRFLAGGASDQIIGDVAEKISAAGGDPSDILALKGQDPEKIKRIARYQLALLDPAAAKAYAEAVPEKGKGFTLTEGQGRYNESNELVAYMPKTVSTLDNELKQEKNKFDQAAKIRAEVEKVSKVYRDVEDSYGRVNAAVSGKPTGASDMALIFNYMKMLDPGSTVREGEFATASNTGGLSATVINAYNKAKDGQMLTPEQRGNFIDQSNAQFKTATDNQLKRLGDYESLGGQYGLTRGEIIVSEPELAQVSLPYGTVDNGDGTHTLPDGRKVRPKK